MGCDCEKIGAHCENVMTELCDDGRLLGFKMTERLLETAKKALIAWMWKLTNSWIDLSQSLIKVH